ncbi:MAG: alpha/beta hydrolase [Actinomycetota bacterium]
MSVAHDVEVLAGAEAFALGEGPVGALIIHGFTSSPQVVRPLGSYLSERGIAAVAPRLPGHGTTWEDLAVRRDRDWIAAVEAAFDELAAVKERVFVVGFSFGASLAVDLVARRQGRVAGLVTIATYLRSDDPRRFLSGIVPRVLKTIPGVGNDTADPEGEREIVYDRIPTSAIHQMLRVTKRARAALGSITVPVLVVHGRNDHTAKPFNARLVYDSVASTDKELVWLDRSYHVLPFDHDRDQLFEVTYRFIRDRSDA